MRKFCPYCGKQITAGAIKCRYCGRILNNIVKKNEDGNESKEQKFEQRKVPLIGLFHLAKRDIIAKFKNKRQRNVAIAIMFSSMLVAMLFYVSGPTEYRVGQLKAAHNDAGLLQMVDARSKYSFFTNVTQSATNALISLQNNEDINSLSKYLLDKNVNIQQKMAIINAFTESKVLVPNFFAVYDQNIQLQEILQKNGLSIDPNIFKQKLFAEVNTLLKTCRNTPGNYDNEIDALQSYNVDGFAEDNMFANLKGIADIYAIQRYLQEGDNAAVLQYLQYLQNQPDVPILAKNVHFFKALAVRVKQEKMASDSIDELNKDIDNMHILDKLQNEQKEMNAAQDEINKTKYIEYFGIKYLNNNTLYVSVSGGGWAEIINPPSEVQSFKKYDAYVINMGEVELTSYFKEWIVPVYKIVDISSAEAIVRQHQYEINKIYSAKLDLEDKIASLLEGKKQAGVEAGKLFNNMGAILNSLTAEEVFDFSKNSGHVPLFEI